MPRRYGRMFLRGKPGIFILVSVISIGLFLAYYTLGKSSTKPSKYSMYKKLNHPGKFPSYQVQKDNRGFSDEVFRKNIRMNQLPKPVQPPAEWNARRNFGGMKNNDQVTVKPRQDPDEDYTDIKQSKPGGFKLYIEPDDAMMPLFRSLKRIVHLDLKGAAPKIEYLEKILPLMTKLGATGVLIEYEDVFPYTGELSILAAENAYSEKDISRLLMACKNNNLEVIPLVQTFGHMEFVLKHQKYQHLREQESMPQVISPVFDESYTLISKMVQQILTAHPDVQYLHIGSDEVYGLGEGKTHELITKGKEQIEIFLEHVVKVANLVKSVRNSVRVIMWDDEIRKIHENTIERSGLHKLVEPMVWNYAPNPRDHLPEDIWVKYGRLFSGVWAASSFKGATGSAQFYTNVSHHLENHLSWVDIIKKLKDEMPIHKFQGVVLTGWQRYDHFATLCELLPEALPSLAVCLETLMNGGFTEAIHRSASKMLNCTSVIELEMPKVGDDNGALVSQDCSFPGSEFYYGTQQLWGVLNKYRNDKYMQSVFQGWLTDYHVKHQFGSPWHMKNLAKKLGGIMTELNSLISPMSRSLDVMFDNYTVTEWVEVNLNQRINKLKEKSQKTKFLLEQKTWPNRPMHVLTVEAKKQMSNVGQVYPGSQMGMAGKGSQMGLAGKGSQMGIAGKGPQMGMAGKGPQMGMAGEGSQMGMAGKGSQMGMAGEGYQMGMAGKGPQMGMAGKGPQMGMAGKGPQMGMAGKGSQMGMAGKGSQMGFHVQPNGQFNKDGNAFFSRPQLADKIQNDPKPQQKLYDSFNRQNMAAMNKFENPHQPQDNVRRQPGVDGFGQRQPAAGGQARLQYPDRSTSQNNYQQQLQDGKNRIVMNLVAGSQRGLEKQSVVKDFENGPDKMDGARNWAGKDDRLMAEERKPEEYKIF